MAATQKSAEELEKAYTLAYIPRCDEYEKMISGMLYDSFVPELEAARFKARAWCHDYNTNLPSGWEPNFRSLTKARAGMLRGCLGHIGDDEVLIEPPFRVDYGCNIRIGKRFYANFNLTILDCALVTIGDRVMFGPNISILSATHETDVRSRRQNIEYARPITIGDDCWIGGHVVILPGVTVGQGCTIGAGAVVTKDVPAWSVAMGIPAKVVRKVEPVKSSEDL